MSENNNEILSINEVAANLRCSKAHVYNAINGKITGVTRLPAIPMGRRRLVRRSSLESWKAANETATVNAAETVYSGITLSAESSGAVIGRWQTQSVRQS